jgi:hypothetical protein
MKMPVRLENICQVDPLKYKASCGNAKTTAPKRCLQIGLQSMRQSRNNKQRSIMRVKQVNFERIMCVYRINPIRTVNISAEIVILNESFQRRYFPIQFTSTRRAKHLR